TTGRRPARSTLPSANARSSPTVASCPTRRPSRKVAPARPPLTTNDFFTSGWFENRSAIFVITRRRSRLERVRAPCGRAQPLAKTSAKNSPSLLPVARGIIAHHPLPQTTQHRRSPPARSLRSLLTRLRLVRASALHPPGTS